MSSIHEITLPVTKPATEWVNGRALRKVSPQEEHARAQRRIAAVLGQWADDRRVGRVGTEWEFRVTPPGEITRPLVPDVAFLSYHRLSYEETEAAQIPYIAPDVVVEVHSPDDRRSDEDEKIRVYLAAGAALVILLDPAVQSLTSYDRTGVRFFSRDETFTHHSLPGLVLKVSSIFELPKPGV